MKKLKPKSSRIECRGSHCRKKDELTPHTVGTETGVTLCPKHVAELQAELGAAVASGPSPEVFPAPVPTTNGTVLAETVSVSVEVPRGEITATETETAGFMSALASVEVHTVADLGAVARVLVEVKARSNALEARKTAIVRPIKEGVKQITALFRVAESNYREIEDTLKSKVVGFYEKRAGQFALAAAALQVAQTDADRALCLRVREENAPPVAPAGIQVRHLRDFEVLSEADIPRAYFTLDRGKVASALAAGEDVPGVRSTVKYSVAVVGE